MSNEDHATRKAHLEGYKEGLEQAAKIADAMTYVLTEGSDIYGVHGPNRGSVTLGKNIAVNIRQFIEPDS